MDALKKERPSDAPPDRAWKFSEILADPATRARWEKVRQYFFLRESTYDMSNRCNIRCEGCYYFEGEKQFAHENDDPEAWRALMRAEKERGITFVVLAGAEPSMAEQLCEACYQEMPLGVIATNGIKRFTESIRYKLHISVWGNDETSWKTRHAKNMLTRQIANYQGDPRAVFVYTFTRGNIDQSREVAAELVRNDCKLTFNVFSAPLGYDGDLRHTRESLEKTRGVMRELLSAHPQHVLFSHYSAVAHTHRLGLHELYSCPYPRMNSSTTIGLGRSFRQYRADLSWDRAAACCVPDTDCADCRHYAAGSAIVTARMFRHSTNPDTFKAWLDYVDTYLSVWVMDYEKDHDLLDRAVAPPPGHTLF